MTTLLALLLILQQDILPVEPRRSPWAPPSGVSHYAQHRVAGWRVMTWTEGSGDRIVRLQRWRPGFTLIYERWYPPGDRAFDRAEVVVGNCARGDPVWQGGRPEPGIRDVRSALVDRLSGCDVARNAADRLLEGFDRAFPLAAARSHAAAADAAANRTADDRPN
jgi:hypothetical protein